MCGNSPTTLLNRSGAYCSLCNRVQPRLKTTMDKRVAARLPQREIVKRTKRADGSTCISGGADLKASQAYPRRFGLAVAQAYHAHVSAPCSAVPALPGLRFSQVDVDILSSSLQMPPGI